MISGNLKSIRLSTGESQSVFAKKFGLSQAVYSQYETGKRSVPDDLKQQLANMGVNIHWLVTGNGAMYLNFKESIPPASMGTISEPPIPYSLKSKKELAGIPQNEDSIPIPFISQKLSAGPGQLWNEDCFTDDVIAIPTRMVKRFKGYKLGAAEVRGDSMDPSLQNGDIIIFAEKMISGNGIYALSIDAEVYVKRIEFDPFDETLRVISDNPKYDAKILPVDTDRVQILGKIIGRFLVYW
ncbi:XRE family transcriptional regulator [uncultured Sphaerochaeta sp.]|uniref:XRE family transcriptional regulator n=1 Tax=uncultured Sphaerochaeta sp. TaxID=886478 RepID=UPI002AA878E2|nr:XRE family transcriptional regulator [uncultured Sphaerochaeta sp.]